MTVLSVSGRLAADRLSGGACSAAKRSRFTAANRRSRSATEAAYKGPVADPSALSTFLGAFLFSVFRELKQRRRWPTNRCGRRMITAIRESRKSSLSPCIDAPRATQHSDGALDDSMHMHVSSRRPNTCGYAHPKTRGRPAHQQVSYLGVCLGSPK